MENNISTCLVADCEKPATHKKRCQRHYNQLRRKNPVVQAAERERKLQKRYGVTAAEADELFALTDYTCQLCGTPAEESPRGLCIDHDHVTGLVRGVLCMSCNVGVAHFADDPQVLHAVIEYLSRAASVRLDHFA